MQIVIDIDETKYNTIMNYPKEWDEWALKAIQHGTPLPKGHGRLIDADEYKEHLYACETNGRPLHTMELNERLATVDDTPTIIEADTESEEVSDTNMKMWEELFKADKVRKYEQSNMSLC